MSLKFTYIIHKLIIRNVHISQYNYNIIQLIGELDIVDNSTHLNLYKDILILIMDNNSIQNQFNY